MLALPWNPKGLVISALEVWEEASGFVKKQLLGLEPASVAIHPLFFH